jgi:hypothetical protein
MANENPHPKQKGKKKKDLSNGESVRRGISNHQLENARNPKEGNVDTGR